MNPKWRHYLPKSGGNDFGNWKLSLTLRITSVSIYSSFFFSILYIKIVIMPEWLLTHEQLVKILMFFLN